MNSSVQHLYTKSEYTIQAACLLMIAFFIVTGNLLIVIAFYKDKSMRSSQYILIGSLSISDFGVGLVAIPLTTITIFNDGKWLLGTTACQFQAFMNSTFFIVTMLTLMIMTIERYFSIVRPLSRFVTQSRTKKTIILTWTVSLIIASFPLLGFGRYDYNQSTLSCGIAFPEVIMETIYLMTVVILGIIMPLVVMICAYIRIFIAVHRHSERLLRHARGAHARASIIRTQKHFVVTLVIILAVFVLSWSPFFVLATLAKSSHTVKDLPRGIGVTAYWVGYAASAWNPIIYVTRNKRFRKGIIEILQNATCKAFGASAAPINTTNGAEEVEEETNNVRERKISLAGIIALVSFNRTNEMI